MATFADSDQIHLLQIFPPELWFMVFSYVKDSGAHCKIFQASPYFEEILRSQHRNTNSLRFVSTDGNPNSSNSIQISQLLANVITEAHNITVQLSFGQISEMLLRPQNFTQLLHIRGMDNVEIWQVAANRLTAEIRQIIEFAKMVPGFMRQPQDDQVTLLKSSAFKIVVIRLSRQFDPGTNSVLIGGILLSKDAFPAADINEKKLISAVFDAARDLAVLKLNETQIALYSAFVLLSPDTPGLRGTKEIELLNAAVFKSLQKELAKTHRDPISGDVLVVDALLERIPQLQESSRLYLEAVGRLRRKAPHLQLPGIHQEFFPVVI